MAGLSWKLSGVDASRWGLLRGTVYRPPVQVRGQTVEVPGRHGVIPVGLPVFTEPQVVLALLAQGANPGQTEAAIAELTGLLSAPGLVVTRVAGGVAQSAAARLLSISERRAVPGKVSELLVTLGLPEVFLRGAVATSPAVVVTSGAVVAVAPVAGSTAPVTDAVLRLAGPLTTVQVVDAVTGTGLSWAGPLTAGQNLYLDAGSLRAWTSGSTSQWTPAGVDVTAALDYPGAGLLQLWPRTQGTDPADRQAKVTVTGSGFGASTSLMVRAAPAYL